MTATENLRTKFMNDIRELLEAMYPDVLVSVRQYDDDLPFTNPTVFNVCIEIDDYRYTQVVSNAFINDFEINAAAIIVEQYRRRLIAETEGRRADIGVEP